MTSIFEQILSTNLINFLIVVMTLVWIYKKANLGALIEKMSEEIKTKVENSSEETKNALMEYKSIKKSSKNKDLLRKEIIDSAKNNAQSLVKNIEEKTLKSEAEIKSSLEKIYNAQNEKIKSTTLREIYCACVDLARDEVKNRLNDELHKKIITSSISELDKI